MKVKVIGCGSAFSKKNFHQSFLVEENDHRMLIDCGSLVPQALDYHGIDIKDIDSIYLSHLHGDHIGGLEWVGFSRYDWINKPRNHSKSKDYQKRILQGGHKNESYAPILIGNVELLKNLWLKSLRGGMESMEGFDSNIETFFQTYPIEPNQHFSFAGWDVSLIQQVHIMTGSIISPTYGLMFKKEGHQTIYFTTDSQHCSPRQMENFYKDADVIFQDCEIIGVNMEENKSIFMSGVHANYAQLAGYPCANSIVLSDDIKAKMWLSHYQDMYNEGKDSFDNNVAWDAFAAKDGFKGFLQLGQEFEF